MALDDRYSAVLNLEQVAQDVFDFTGTEFLSLVALASRPGKKGEETIAMLAKAHEKVSAARSLLYNELFAIYNCPKLSEPHKFLGKQSVLGDKATPAQLDAITDLAVVLPSRVFSSDARIAGVALQGSNRSLDIEVTELNESKLYKREPRYSMKHHRGKIKDVLLYEHIVELWSAPDFEDFDKKTHGEDFFLEEKARIIAAEAGVGYAGEMLQWNVMNNPPSTEE